MVSSFFSKDLTQRLRSLPLLVMLVGGLGQSPAVQAQPTPEITVELPGGAHMDFVWVEPGRFTMGTRQEVADQLNQVSMWRGDGGNQLPAHNVTLTQGFYIGKFELTQQQWLSVMGQLPPSLNDTPKEMGPDHPVTQISWDAAQTFVWTLNQTVGDSLYRLPTEAEWEYACRAGTQTLWSFGVEAGQMRQGEYPLLAENAWISQNSCTPGSFSLHCNVQPVGTKPANPWGIHDMHGNVWEWVLDGPRTYTTYPVEDPVSPLVGRERVRRGGDIFYSEFDRNYLMQSTSAFRSIVFNTSRYFATGMRLVRFEAPMNRHPRADAGPDQFGDPGQIFTLDGSASRDPNGMPLRFEWLESAENPVRGLVQDPQSAVTTVTLPEYGAYRFELVVSDGLDSVADVVEIVIPRPPVQPRQEVLTLELHGGESMDFVWIEPGTFTMGFSPEQEAVLHAVSGSRDIWAEDLQRPHSVTITQGFYMATHEITRRQWVAVMGTRPWEVDHHLFDIDDMPATRLSWNDVQDFIGIQNGAIGAEVFRLPTEAEWEYAYRAGTTTIWPFGDDQRLREEYGNRQIRAIASKPPNPWGLYGMIGNALEWCHDHFRAFDGSHVVDPVGGDSDGKMIVGSFSRRENRHYFEPTFTNSISGARLIVWGPDLSTSVKAETWGRIKKAFQRR